MHQYSAFYPNMASELTTIANALSTDPTRYPATVETPPKELCIGADKTAFTNDVLIVVNKGKGARLLPSDMANVIAGSSGPPVIYSPPALTGTPRVGSNLTCTAGQWQHFPDRYLFQWRRNGVKFDGTDATFDYPATMQYALVGADQNTTVTCQVSAANEMGMDAVESNGVAVT